MTMRAEPIRAHVNHGWRLPREMQSVSAARVANRAYKISAVYGILLVVLPRLKQNKFNRLNYNLFSTSKPG